MIEKLKDYNHGYKLTNATDEEWKKLTKKYVESEGLRCIICNKDMARRFRIGLLGDNIITVNNRVLDDVVFLNYFW